MLVLLYRDVLLSFDISIKRKCQCCFVGSKKKTKKIQQLLSFNTTLNASRFRFPWNIYIVTTWQLNDDFSLKKKKGVQNIEQTTPPWIFALVYKQALYTVSVSRVSSTVALWVLRLGRNHSCVLLLQFLNRDQVFFRGIYSRWGRGLDLKHTVGGQGRFQAFGVHVFRQCVVLGKLQVYFLPRVIFHVLRVHAQRVILCFHAYFFRFELTTVKPQWELPVARRVSDKGLLHLKTKRYNE